ncbi:unnamed protein product, partial [marine sediment metagenome]
MWISARLEDGRVKEPKKITMQLVKAHGLTKEEYDKIEDILGARAQLYRIRYLFCYV